MPHSPPIDPVACTVDAFCRSLSIGRSTFYKEVRAGRIRVAKIGRRTIVPLSEQARYLALITGTAGDGEA